jgi:hypothetical protein
MSDTEYTIDLSLYYEAVADRYLRFREREDADALFQLASRRVTEAEDELLKALKGAQASVAAHAMTDAALEKIEP